MMRATKLLLEITAVAAWVVSVVLGRLPQGLFDPMVLASSYIARSDAYLFLLTETYPPFQDAQTRTAGIDGGERLVPDLQQAAPQFEPAAALEQPAPKFDS